MCEEDTKIKEIFDKDIENFGKDLEKMIEHLNIVIATHNKQVEEIERLNNIINKAIKNIEWLRNTHHKTENIAYTKAVYNTNELLQILHILKGSNNNE